MSLSITPEHKYQNVQEKMNLHLGEFLHVYTPYSTCESIKKCIYNYNSYARTQSTFDYIIYRICQTVLAIFGKSDWQAARKEMINLMQKPTSCVRFTLLPTESHQRFVADSIIKVYIDTIDFYVDNYDNEDVSGELDQFMHACYPDGNYLRTNLIKFDTFISKAEIEYWMKYQHYDPAQHCVFVENKYDINKGRIT